MKQRIFLLLANLLITIAAFAQGNKLYIPDVTAQQGNTIPLSICVDNTDPIVAAQFTIRLPQDSGLELDVSSAKLTARGAKSHMLTCRKKGENEYLIFAYSSKNTAFTKSEGAILTIDLNANVEKTQTSQVFDIILADVVLAQKDGTNVADKAESCTLTLIPERTLHLSMDSEEITEGQTGVLTVTANVPAEGDTRVTLESDLPSRLLLPSSIVIPSGKMSATVTVNTFDDNEPDIERVVEIRASAKDFTSGRLLTTLLDDDVPDIDFKVNVSVLAEDAGLQAITATIHRYNNTRSNVRIKLSDDSHGDIYYDPQFVTMAPGVIDVEVPIGIKDNSRVDGDRDVTLTAAVYVSSCNCNALGTQTGACAQTIRILDNDGPALSVKSSRTTVKEGEKKATVLTISRNTDEKRNIEVNISSDHDDVLVYNHHVVIPADKQSVDVVVETLNNDIQGDDTTITFVAEADTYAKGTFWIWLTDQTLPDATITGVTVLTPEVVIGEKAQVKVQVANTGVGVLPAPTKVQLCIDGKEWGNVFTSTDIAPGETVDVVSDLIVPNKTGNKTVYAVVNPKRTEKELNYSNNTSASASITLLAPFAGSLHTDKDVYQVGEAVRISGELSGSAIAETEVDVYVVNNTSRQKIRTKTDGEGRFVVEYTPKNGQIGHFGIGVCYPDDTTNEELAVFNVMGLSKVNPNKETYSFHVGVPYTGYIDILNPADCEQNNVTARVVSGLSESSIEFGTVERLASKDKAQLPFTITMNEASSGTLRLELVSEEGSASPVYVGYNCRYQEAYLRANVGTISTTMSINGNSEYTFTLKNYGAGETGKVRLDLPEFMGSTSAISSIAPGDSVDVVLQFYPNDKMKTNVPVTGNLVIRGEHATPLSMYYRIVPVSTNEGQLELDVCDEYTYYTEEAPHVEGADIVITMPNSNMAVYQGTSDENGLFHATLPEGHYTLKVTADEHEDYIRPLYIAPGSTNKETVNMSVNAVTMSWNVTETEVEDKYEIKTDVTYKTNVPKPIVVIECNDKINIDDMNPGETKMLVFTLTNKGLITALETDFVLPEFYELTMTPLVASEHMTLAPGETIEIPVLVQKNNVEEDSNRRNAPEKFVYQQCMDQITSHYKHMCGTEMQDNEAYFKLMVRGCAIEHILSAWTGNNPYSESSLSETPRGSVYYGNAEKFVFCDPKFAESYKNLVDFLPNLLSNFPLVGHVFGLGTAAEDFSYDYWRYHNGKMDGWNYIKSNLRLLNAMISPSYGYLRNSLLERMGVEEAERELIDRILDTIGNIRDWSRFISDYGNVLREVVGERTQNRPKANKAPDYTDQTAIALAATEEYEEQLDMLINLMTSLLGDETWFTTFDESMFVFLEKVQTLEEGEFTYDNLLVYKPNTISDEQLRVLIDRFNGTSDAINYADVTYYLDRYLEMGRKVKEEGYETVYDKFAVAVNTVMETMNQKSKTVCASVGLQFKQTLALTRQAFRGTLTMYNGHESEPLENFTLHLEIKDSNGNIATSREFQTDIEHLTTFEGNADLDAEWELDAQKTGTATVVFIPTKYAAEKEDKVYGFGGYVSYLDPFTNLMIKREMSPVWLTVRPTPELELTYFMQRDIIGDNPNTEYVEPSEEAEFALLINNVGNGDASNLSITTEQPVIVDNEKGLAIKFEITRGQVDGEEKTLGLGSRMVNTFGDLPAQSTTYAQWWFTSSLLGHFSEYNVEVNHVTSHGNPDLSLINNTTIHELIRSIEPGTEEKNVAWLVNDIADVNDTPDMLYYGNGDMDRVYISTKSECRFDDRTEIRMTAVPSADGWNYIRIDNPIFSGKNILSITRESDGSSVPLRNLWQTNVTMREGMDPKAEVCLHFIDKMYMEEDNVYLITLIEAEGDSNATMKIGDAQYSTFCAPFVVEVPTGVVAYTVEGVSENGSTLILNDIYNFIPSHTPVIVYSESPMEETFTGMKEEGEPVFGLLVGTYEDIFAPEGSYVLQSKEGVTGFYLVNHEIAKPAVRANHAYLSAPTNSIGRYSLNDAGILDAIETIQGTPGNQIIIDLQGRHVNSVRRGVYIANGRKLVK